MCFYFRSTLIYMCYILQSSTLYWMQASETNCNDQASHTFVSSNFKLSVLSYFFFFSLFNKSAWKMSFLEEHFLINLRFLLANPYAYKMIQVLHKIIQLFFMRGSKIHGILSLHQSKPTDIGSHMRTDNTWKVTSEKYAVFSSQ